MATIWKVLTRKKIIDPITAEETRLSRVLNTFDLTALGVGSTLGVGVYVLAGHVAKDTAGPAVVLSFLIAAIASVFAGLCYAEFGARAPRAGSAYIYSYVCVGELAAFVIGWNLILEYVIGSASVARGLSSYLDSLINHTMQNAFIDVAPINVPYFSQYFDFFAFGISIALSIALAFGMKESSLVNNIFTVLNIGVVLFVVIAGSIKADPDNWAIKPDQNGTTNSTEIGNGGFFPFGVEGMIKGAATCFYGFVGFDCIATTAEEVKNPKRAIPLSIILSLFIIFLAYFGTSTVVTLMVPYYLQDRNAPIPYAFEHIGWNTAKWIVSIGGIFGLCASLFGAMFPLPRIIYAMASDSLVFKFLGKVHSRFQTPVIGTLLAGLLTGLMAAMFELKQLVNMMSIGTLMAYTIVAVSILILRYAKEETRRYMPVQVTSDSDDSETYTDNKFVINSNEDSEDNELLHYQDNRSIVGQIFNCGRHKNPTKISALIVSVEIAVYCLMCIFIGLSAMYLKNPLLNGEVWAIVLTSLVIFIAVVLVISMATQPTSNRELSFKVPLVPLVPALSILINIYLMLMLDSHTWIRFGIWMAVGLPIYYFSVRPYTEAQNKNVSSKSSIDYNVTMVNSTQNGKLNGHTNVAYVDDFNEINNEIESSGPRKKAAPQPPIKSNDEVISNEIPAEITRLDEILEEASHSINTKSVDRKLSVGTSSNVSDVVSREENVVAVVHRDNVVTPANSNAPPSPSDDESKSFFDSNELISDNLDNVSDSTQTKIVDNDNDTTEISPVDILANDVHNKQIEIQETPSAGIVKIEMQNSAPARQDSVDSPLPLEAEADKSNNLLQAEQGPPENLPSTPTPPPSPSSSPLPKEKVENSHTPPSPPLPLPTDELKAIRPTSANLNSVTLRHVTQNEVAEKEQENEYEPGEDNLKVGSEKYKSFMASLSGKLQKINEMPPYVPYVPRNVPPPNNNLVKEERKPNENIIEESINQKAAKDRLSKIEGFLTKHLYGEFKRGPEKDKQENEENKEENEKDKQEAPIQINIEDVNGEVKEEANKIVDNQTSDGDYMNHKNRMQNVFRSINLKKSDSFNESAPEEGRRNVKSLGASFANDDKFKHRQAMSEIFKTIRLRRTDSQKRENLSQ